jgi:UPF0271 protein
MEIDLNCDLGEGFGPYAHGHDPELLQLVSSANIACGFHAGDPATMRRTVRLARARGVSVGAHPSYPDLLGFGRRHLACSPEEIRDDVTYQLGALWAFCRSEGLPLAHVKPHGALYNAAARDLPTALAVAEAVRAVDPALWLVCLAGSLQVEAARRTGLRHVEEGFADRAYLPDGQLLPRTQPGAVIHDRAQVEERVVRLLRERRVAASDGSLVPLTVQTLCVHGDTPDAVELVRAVRRALEAAGVAVRSFSAGA